MVIRRVIRAFRVEATLAGLAYVALLVFANPGRVVDFLRLAADPWVVRLYNAGLVLAMVLLACLAIRAAGRLLALRPREEAWGGCRAVSGTVMTEFALVLPILLLLMSLIVQLALIANATLVVRYAAFMAARSAIVNMEDYPIASRPPSPLVRPLMTRPTRAAELVLASISPMTGGLPSSPANSMEAVLQAQRNSVWQGRNYANRWRYAHNATRVTNTLNIFEAQPPLVPRTEHMTTPYELSQGQTRYFLPVLTAQSLLARLGITPVITITITIPIEIKIKGVTVFQYDLQIPINVDITPVYNILVNAIQPVLHLVSRGGGAALAAYSETVANVDPLAPKEVGIEVTHEFLLTLPSLHFVPGVNLVDAPGGGKAFPITHTVYLQSNGGRQASWLAAVGLVLRKEYPIWWKN